MVVIYECNSCGFSSSSKEDFEMVNYMERMMSNILCETCNRCYEACVACLESEFQLRLDAIKTSFKVNL